MSIPVLYHGGLPHGTTLSDIDVFRVSTKQNGKHKSEYAGFYLTDNKDVAERYNGFSDEGGVFEVRLKSDARVLELKNDVTRIKKSELVEYSKDYDLIRGKNVLGKVEYVLLNKDAVGSFKEMDSKNKNASLKATRRQTDMERNTRIAKELVRIARMLVATTD